jgi:hypothetical protein
MKSTQVIRMLLASLMLAMMATAATAQTRPTPTPISTPKPVPTLPPKPIAPPTPIIITLPTPTATPTPTPGASPSPVLYLTSTEPYTANGHNFIRYKYDVLNKDVYPAALFTPAPTLPPCGSNTNSARTWVDIFDQSGKRLYGFCALGKPADLGSLWFALEEGVVPPSYVYIEMNDRQTNTKYRSNLADTTL